MSFPPTDRPTFPVLGDRRAAGVLVHVSSLPGPDGIGDLGPATDAALDWMVGTGATVWQVLPLAPPGTHGSPYDGLSAFAGDPRLVSPERLAAEGLLPPGFLSRRPELPRERVDLARTAAWKDEVIRASLAHAGGDHRETMVRFREEERHWIEDWALFAALREHLGGAWTSWPESLRRRDPAALAGARKDLGEAVDRHVWGQLLFRYQWRRVREEATRRGLLLFGDIPIYVAGDSADAWAERQVFELDEAGRAPAVAGVPPDLFSATGQRWGNPLYDWGHLARTGFDWWCRRLRQELSRLDLLRLDHFRGFAGYWRVPAESETAVNGTWEPGPGRPLFEAVERTLGRLPLVAEDLGVITEDVTALRRGLGLPGMRVLQFGFGDPDSDHLPHRHEPLTVVYPGTHDNPTTREWWEGQPERVRQHLRSYLGPADDGAHRALVRAAWSSVGQLAVASLQDVLGLGAEARMNTPGVAAGNWTWRATEEQLDDEAAAWLRELTAATGRSRR